MLLFAFFCVCKFFFSALASLLKGARTLKSQSILKKQRQGQGSDRARHQGAFFPPPRIGSIRRIGGKCEKGLPWGKEAQCHGKPRGIMAGGSGPIAASRPVHAPSALGDGTSYATGVSPLQRTLPAGSPGFIAFGAGSWGGGGWRKGRGGKRTQAAVPIF